MRSLSTTRRTLAGGLLFAALGFAAVSCAAADSGKPLETWQSLGDKPLPYEVDASPEHPIAGSDVPVAGIVSHHLLMSAHIEAWFAALASAREVDTFIILSPAHFGESDGGLMACTGNWTCGGDALVRTNAAMLDRMGRRGRLLLGKEAFIGEHGITTLIPFIHSHFPEARVVALIAPGEPPLSEALAKNLCAIVEPELEGKKAGKTFLIVSSDFSHHTDQKTTIERDLRSRIFIEKPGPSTSFRAGCDNRPGMYLLGELAGKQGLEGRLLWRTDAMAVFPKLVDPKDVTSYFFWFLVRPGTDQAAAPNPDRADLGTFRLFSQTWNNCGADALSSLLFHYGVDKSQQELSGEVRSSLKDPCATLSGIAECARRHGVSAVQGMGGTTGTLERCIAAGFPVIVKSWMLERGKDGCGHTLLVTGYDRARRLFTVQDPLKGPNLQVDYRDLEEEWRVLGSSFIAFGKATEGAALSLAVGDRADPKVGAAGLELECRNLLAHADTASRETTALLWYELGLAQDGLGKWAEAAKSFDTAWALGIPSRILWYDQSPLDAWFRTGQALRAREIAQVAYNRYPFSDELQAWLKLLSAQ